MTAYLIIWVNLQGVRISISNSLSKAFWGQEIVHQKVHFVFEIVYLVFGMVYLVFGMVYFNQQMSKLRNCLHPLDKLISPFCGPSEKTSQECETALITILNFLSRYQSDQISSLKSHSLYQHSKVALTSSKGQSCQGSFRKNYPAWK